MPASLAARIDHCAHLTGEFRLRSGVTSDEYFDKYRFEADPSLLREIAEGMAPLLPAEVDALAGLELGGIPLVTMLSQVTGLAARFVRKRAKDYGTCRLAEGGDVAGQRLVIVEDVVTSAGQIIESCQQLRELGADISLAVCAIDRRAGGAANLAEIGVELRALLTIDGLVAARTASSAGDDVPAPPAAT